MISNILKDYKFFHVSKWGQSQFILNKCWKMPKNTEPYIAMLKNAEQSLGMLNNACNH